MGMEMEDDAFFAELSKRIALLIMEEDEEIGQVMAMPPQFPDRRWSQREAKGTGVFIPLSLLPKKKNIAAAAALCRKPKPAAAAAATAHSGKAIPGGAAGKSLYHHRRPPPRQLRW